MLRNHLNVLSLTLVQDASCLGMNECWNHHAVLLCEAQIAQLTFLHSETCHFQQKICCQRTYSVFDVERHHQRWATTIRCDINCGCDWDSNDRTRSVTVEMAVRQMWPWTVSVLSLTIQVFSSLCVHCFNENKIQFKRKRSICSATVNTDPVWGSEIRIYSRQLPEHYLHNDHALYVFTLIFCCLCCWQTGRERLNMYFYSIFSWEATDQKYQMKKKIDCNVSWGTFNVIHLILGCP